MTECTDCDLEVMLECNLVCHFLYIFPTEVGSSHAVYNGPGSDALIPIDWHLTLGKDRSESGPMKGQHQS